MFRFPSLSLSWPRGGRCDLGPNKEKPHYVVSPKPHELMAVTTLARPLLQIALDTVDLPSALRPLQAASEFVDVIEVGTVLCLSEGMHAVRAVKALFPEKPVLADIRIAEAGSLLSALAFDAGADWVSVVAGASLTTVQQVCKVAADRGGQTQVELGDVYNADLALRWRDAGAEHVIVKRSRDREAAGDLSWREDDIDRIHELHGMGFTVTITGGVTERDLPVFEGCPVGIVIAGRALVAAQEPRDAAEAMQRGLARVWS